MIQKKETWNSYINLNDSDEMIPGSSLIGDPEFAEKGMYYYTSNEIRNSIEDEIELYDREWRKNYISSLKWLFQ